MEAILSTLKQGPVALIREYMENKDNDITADDNKILKATIDNNETEAAKYILDNSQVIAGVELVKRATKAGSIDLVKYFLDEAKYKSPVPINKELMFLAVDGNHDKLVVYFANEKKFNNREDLIETLKRAVEKESHAVVLQCTILLKMSALEAIKAIQVYSSKRTALEIITMNHINQLSNLNAQLNNQLINLKKPNDPQTNAPPVKEEPTSITNEDEKKKDDMVDEEKKSLE